MTDAENGGRRWKREAIIKKKRRKKKERGRKRRLPRIITDCFVSLLIVVLKISVAPSTERTHP